MIKVGLVGYGFMGRMHKDCYLATGEVQIAGVADVEPDRRADAQETLGCKAFDSVDAMLADADIDLVDVCTPTFLHEEQVVKAAGAGKHVLCEKPMALTVEACDRMIDAVEKSGVLMMVAQVIRFWPEYQVIKQIVDSGRYGRVQWLSASRLGGVPAYAWRNWFGDPKRSGGAILDLHIHDQDYIAYLIGAPKHIRAQASAGAGGGLDSVMSMGWGHGSGAASFAQGSLALAPGYPFNMSLVVACEQATIKYDMSSDPTLVVYPFDGEPYTPELPGADVGASSDAGGNIASLGGYFNEIKYFLECVKAGRKPEIVTPRTAREAVRICLAARKSAETGEAVDL